MAIAPLSTTPSTVPISVAPLDSQFGVAEPKAVPDDLKGLLFGDPALQTYAILDAAKVTNLPELLEGSGLEHRCLFKGGALDDLGTVAPWIVQLDPASPFTRFLFTCDPAQDVAWHLWGKNPGIFLRAPGTLDDLWRHFRKFTRVQDEHDKWYYFRFWEPIFLNAYFAWPDKQTTLARDLTVAAFGQIELLVPGGPGLYRYPAPANQSGNSMGPRINRAEIEAIYWALYKTDLGEQIVKTLPAETPVSTIEIAAMIDAGTRIGFGQGEALANFVTAFALAHHHGIHFEEIYRNTSADYPYNKKFLSRDLLERVQACLPFESVTP